MVAGSNPARGAKHFKHLAQNRPHRLIPCVGTVSANRLPAFPKEIFLNLPVHRPNYPRAWSPLGRAKYGRFSNLRCGSSPSEERRCIWLGAPVSSMHCLAVCKLADRPSLIPARPLVPWEGARALYRFTTVALSIRLKKHEGVKRQIRCRIAESFHIGLRRAACASRGPNARFSS